MLCVKLPCIKTDSRAFWLRVLPASGCIGDGGSSSCSTSLPARMARGKKAHPARRGELPLLCQDFAGTRVGATQLCPPLPMAGLLLHMPLCVLPELCRALCFQAAGLSFPVEASRLLWKSRRGSMQGGSPNVSSANSRRPSSKGLPAKRGPQAAFG